MDKHSFYNLIQGRIKLARIGNNAIHKYPEWFIDEYNKKLDEIDEAATLVNRLLTEQQQQENDRMKLVCKHYGHS